MRPPKQCGADVAGFTVKVQAVGLLMFGVLAFACLLTTRISTFGYDSLCCLTDDVARQRGDGVAALAPQPGAAAQGEFERVPIGRENEQTLTGDTRGNNGSVSYGLDKVGNRESRTSSVPAVSTAAHTFNSRDWLNTDVYDANGNTLTSSFSSVSVPDVYDFEDRLIIRYKPDGSTVNLSYDADGILRQKTVFNISATLVSATGYMTDAQNPTGYAQVLEERINTTAGTTVKLYAYGSDLISQSVVSGPSSVVTHYHAYDGLGSVRALTNAAGTITDSYDYDAFGILIYSSTSTSNLNTDYLYRGERFDSDIGQYSLRARFYNQATGRFWNQDTYEGSASDPMSLHKYLYASGNPVMGFDPSGRMTLVESVKTAGIVGTLAILTMPQVMQMGVRAVSTIIEAGLYGAGQATESIYGRLPAYTLTLKIEKANARVIPAEEEKRRGRSAVIGENMIRTGFAGFYLGAETFAPIEFGGEMLPEEMTTQEDFNLWMWANRAWIRSVMARGMRIYDIGRDMTRVAQGKKVSQFYAMESEETAAYLFKTNYYWPPSDPFGK